MVTRKHHTVLAERVSAEAFMARCATLSREMGLENTAHLTEVFVKQTEIFQGEIQDIFITGSLQKPLNPLSSVRVSGV